MKVPTDVPRGRDYLSMLIRVWPIILLATVLSGGAAVAVEQLRKPSYIASTTMFATVTGDPSTFASYYGGMGAKVRIPTYVGLATSTLVLQRTIDQLKLPTTVADLSGRVTAAWTPGGADLRGRANSVVLRVSVTDRRPEDAVREVNAISENLMAVSRELEWHESKPADEIQFKGAIAELVPVGTAQAAQLVPVPVARPLAIGAGVGLAVSMMIMLAVEIGRDTVGNRGQLDHIVKRATRSTT